MKTPSTPTGWWSAYFDDVYFRLHEPLFPEARSRAEVAAIIELLGLPAGSRILDAPCGWGRHARLLATAGYAVYGADSSLDLLRHAAAANSAARPRRARTSTKRAAEGSPSQPQWIAADLRYLPFRAHTFDAVINVFSNLGLFLDDAQDVVALREARRVLRPGGMLLLETMHRDDVIASYATRDRWRLPDGTEVRVRRRFDPVTGISEERLRWRRGAERGEKRHALRLRTATDIDRLLYAAGFERVDYHGEWDASPLAYDSPRLIALAR
ncbi:MAG: class I SAM-dependent methyltransferase [Longimicrobiales bacterium]